MIALGGVLGSRSRLRSVSACDVTHGHDEAYSG